MLVYRAKAMVVFLVDIVASMDSDVHSVISVSLNGIHQLSFLPMCLYLFVFGQATWLW